MVIVQHFSGSAKDYAQASTFPGREFAIPKRCPHPECKDPDHLIRWGTYDRGVNIGDINYRISIQRVRCKGCGRTHSLLPDFVQAYRRYAIDLMQHMVSRYVIKGQGWSSLEQHMPSSDLDRSTVREWVSAFAYGAGDLLLDQLRHHVMVLDPAAELPDSSPEQFQRVPNPEKRRLLERAHTFWLLAEQLYALVKTRQPRLLFAADQLFSFLLHWLQNQALPPRLFWSPSLPNTPTTPF